MFMEPCWVRFADLDVAPCSVRKIAAERPAILADGARSQSASTFGFQDDFPSVAICNSGMECCKQAILGVVEDDDKPSGRKTVFGVEELQVQ
jgi:hypothetical protein